MAMQRRRQHGLTTLKIMLLAGAGLLLMVIVMKFSKPQSGGSPEEMVGDAASNGFQSLPGKAPNAATSNTTNNTTAIEVDQRLSPEETRAWEAYQKQNQEDQKKFVSHGDKFEKMYQNYLKRQKKRR